MDSINPYDFIWSKITPKQVVEKYILPFFRDSVDVGYSFINVEDAYGQIAPTSMLLTEYINSPYPPLYVPNLHNEKNKHPIIDEETGEVIPGEFTWWRSCNMMEWFIPADYDVGSFWGIGDVIDVPPTLEGEEKLLGHPLLLPSKDASQASPLIETRVWNRENAFKQPRKYMEEYIAALAYEGFGFFEGDIKQMANNPSAMEGNARWTFHIPMCIKKKPDNRITRDYDYSQLLNKEMLGLKIEIQKPLRNSMVKKVKISHNIIQFDVDSKIDMKDGVETATSRTEQVIDGYYLTHKGGILVSFMNWKLNPL